MVFCLDFSKTDQKEQLYQKYDHTLKENEKNLFQSLFTNFYNILHYYDRDKKIPIFGINGKPFNSNLTSGFFPLTKDFNNCFAECEKELNEIYENSIKYIKPGDIGESRITNSIFSLLETSKEEFKMNELNYFIAVYILKNDLDDLDILVHSLKGLAEYPLSVILVGVGKIEEKFKNLKEKLEDFSKEFERKISCFFFYFDEKEFDNFEDFCSVCVNHLPNEILKFYQQKNFKMDERIIPMSRDEFLRKKKRISRF